MTVLTGLTLFPYCTPFRAKLENTCEREKGTTIGRKCQNCQSVSKEDHAGGGGQPSRPAAANGVAGGGRGRQTDIG